MAVELNTIQPTAINSGANLLSQYPSHQEMPVSLVGQAFLAAASSNWLNPPNQGQSVISRYLGKPLRCLGRLIYSLAIPLLVSVVGVFYHLCGAIYKGIQACCTHDEYRKKFINIQTSAHIKAYFIDLCVLSCLGLMQPFGIYGTPTIFFAAGSAYNAFSVSHYFSDRVIKEGGPHNQFVLNELRKRA